MVNLHRVAVAQVGSCAYDPAGTVEKLTSVMHDASARGASLLLFPEAVLGTYPKGLLFGSPVGKRTDEGRDQYLRYWRSAVELEGPEIAALCDAAQRLSLFTVVGVVERNGKSLYCTAIMIEPSGCVSGIHRKVMPTGSERLIWGSGDGSTLPVVASPAGKVGAVICWENYMPLLRTAMYQQGVEIYCAPTADDRETWLPTMRHIALEGRCFVLSACQVMRRRDYPEDYAPVFGQEPSDLLMRGGSAIIAPTGEVLRGPVFDEEAMLIADVDLDDLVRQSLDFDAVGHYARGDIFHLHVDRGSNWPLRSSMSEFGEPVPGGHEDPTREP